MSNLNENIKKHLLEKVVDIIEIIGLLVALYFILGYAFVYGDWVGVVLLGIAIVGFFFVSKYTGKAFDKWKVPELTMEEEKSDLLVDTFSFIVLAILFSWFLSRYINIKLLLGFFIVVFAIKEFTKWRTYNKKKDGHKLFIKEKKRLEEENVKESEEQPTNEEVEEKTEEEEGDVEEDKPKSEEIPLEEKKEGVI